MEEKKKSCRCFQRRAGYFVHRDVSGKRKKDMKYMPLVPIRADSVPNN